MKRRVFGSAAAALLVTLLVTAAAQQSGSTIPTARIFEAIGVREGITVCEMGAGDGELSIAAAKAVGPSGRVYCALRSVSRSWSSSAAALNF